MGILSKKKEIGPDTLLQRKPDILFNEIDGEVVMLSIENSEYYGMDRVGSHIWEKIKEPISFKQLVNNLIKEYNVNEQQCIKDTTIFITNLLDKKLILIR